MCTYLMLACVCTHVHHKACVTDSMGVINTKSHRCLEMEEVSVGWVN